MIENLKNLKSIKINNINIYNKKQHVNLNKDENKKVITSINLNK